ncbi:hypothetical protein Q5752_003943 [Cryptotrichosporon argae]
MADLELLLPAHFLAATAPACLAAPPVPHATSSDATTSPSVPSPIARGSALDIAPSAARTSAPHGWADDAAAWLAGLREAYVLVVGHDVALPAQR